MSRAQAIKEGINRLFIRIYWLSRSCSGNNLGNVGFARWRTRHGDYPLHLNTAYSIELNAASYIEEWGKEIRIMSRKTSFVEHGIWHLDSPAEIDILTIQG